MISYSDITWTSLHLKPPATCLIFNRLLTLTTKKESKLLPITGTLWGEYTADRWQVSLTSSQWFGKRFHVMTLLCRQDAWWWNLSMGPVQSIFPQCYQCRNFNCIIFYYAMLFKKNTDVGLSRLMCPYSFYDQLRPQLYEIYRVKYISCNYFAILIYDIWARLKKHHLV